MDRPKMATLMAAGLVGAVLASAATAAGAAQPSPQPITVQPYTRVVSFGDLALGTRTGRDVFMHRVHAAVAEVCPYLDENGRTYDVQDCREFAWAGARPQIRRAIDQARSGQLVAMSIEITSGARN